MALETIPHSPLLLNPDTVRVVCAHHPEVVLELEPGNSHHRESVRVVPCPECLEEVTEDSKATDKTYRSGYNDAMEEMKCEMEKNYHRIKQEGYNEGYADGTKQ